MDSTINNVQVTETAQVHATTAFTAQDQAKTVEPHGPVSEVYDILATKDYSALSLHDLLSQPVPVANGVFTGPIPAPFTFTSHTSLLTASPFHLEKLKGYHGIRATAVLRLVVNADKYTQGVLAVGFLPSTNVVIEGRSASQFITQLQHVELDVNTDTEVVLKVPHRGPYSHYDIVNKRYDTGVFIVAPTLFLSGNPIPYTVYLSFEDVDLLGPTSTFQVAYQSGMGGRVTIEEETKDKPISSVLSKISSALTVAAAVPVLTPFIEPMAWASGVASSVMSAFGYAKPCITTTPGVFVRRDIGKINHADGADYAEQLAMTTTTGVRVSDQIGLTNHDELSFAYLCGIRSQMYAFSHNIATPNGTKLFSFPLDPWSMKTTLNYFPAGTGTGEYQAVVAHPMAYVANMFSYYRGSIEVTLHISKTIFHTGRLLVVFEPAYNDDRFDLAEVNATAKVNTVADAINCHKDIVDLRQGNKFSFAFPFTSLTPYLPVGRPYGWVHIFALNSLVRNDTAVSDFVTIGVRVNACDDMEFAAPGDPVMWPMAVNSVQDTQVIDNRTLDGVVYQSGLEVSETVIVTKPIGSSAIPRPDTKMSELCIGEKILSLKQLAMRGKIVETSLGAIAGQFDPFTVDAFRQGPQLAPGAKPWYDFYSYAGAPFAYSRGGCILSFQKSDSVPLMVGIKVVEYDSSDEPRDVYGEFCNFLPMRSEPGGDRVYVPPYNASFVRYNSITPSTVSSREYKTTGHSQVKLRIYAQTGTNGTTRDGLVYNIYRSAAEDTQFGGFQGIPPMVYREPYHLGFDTRICPKTTAFTFPISNI